MQVRTTNTPPPSGRSGRGVTSQPGVRVGSTGRTGHIFRTSGGRSTPSDSSYWNGYDYSQAPVYPDTSFRAYLKAGGNLLGIGYIAWRDKQIADYQTAYNLYQQYYDSAGQQRQRIIDAGLNENLAYGSITPGSPAGSPAGGSTVPTVGEVAAQGAQVLSGLTGSLKTLSETAGLLYELPESKFKGNLAKALDIAAAAEAFNSGNVYTGMLNNARISAGVPGSKAQREKSENLLGSATADANRQTLDWLTTHNEEGEETDFNSSVWTQSAAADKSSAIISYRKNKKEWDSLFSKPQYWKAMLEKAVADSEISQAQAWKVMQIINDDTMGNDEKVLALQDGVPGFFAKIAYYLSKNITNGAKSLWDSIFNRTDNPEGIRFPF